MRLPLAIFFCLSLTRLFAQQSGGMVIDLASIRHFDSIDSKCFFLATPKGQVPEASIPSLVFPSPPLKKRSVADSLMEKDCYLKFTLRNNADTAKEVYFLPGYYLKSLKLYAASPEDPVSTFRELPLIRDDKQAYADCKLIRIGPGETVQYFAKFNYVKTNINSYIPRIIEKDYLEPWTITVKNRDSMLDTITYVVCGILLLMIFYSLAVYLQSRNREFLYYSAYALCTAALLFLKSYLNFEPSRFHELYEEYLDFILMCGGVFFYLIFVRQFLNTKENHPFIEKTFRRTETAILALLLVFSLIYFFTDKYVILNILENYVIKTFLFLIGFAFIIYSIRKKDPLLNYLAIGSLAMVFFSIVSLSIILLKWKVVPGYPASVFNRSMLYYETGLALELMFFLSGLAYKNKKEIIERVKERERLKMENERKEFEKQMAVMEERDRISADMHDDLGSGVTAIRLMSEIAKSKMNTEEFPEIDKISNSANELLGKMNAIIWTMKSSNDTLESLVAYLRAYAIEYFDGSPIRCVVNVKNIHEMEMSGEKRRNIFLSFKETLTNIRKHAQATEAVITIEAEERRLRLSIQDNGRGIDLDNLRKFGNGLSNMKKRMQHIKGECIIENNNGALVYFIVPL